MEATPASERKSRHRRPSNPKSRLVPIKQFCEEMGLAYGSVRDAVFRGELPVVRIGKAWYFERKDGDQWIANKKEQLEGCR